MKPVNPALLVNERIKVIFDTQAPETSNPAQVQETCGIYTITVYKNAVSKLVRETKIPENQLILGLLYHEVAHIRFDSFKNLKANDSLHHWIDNVIEDTRVEYNMSFDYPYVAKYIALVLIATKNHIMTDALEDNAEIEQLTTNFLRMVRLNIIPDGCDEEFAEFCLPRILLARRSNRLKSSKIVEELYNYMSLSIEDPSRVAPEEFDPYKQDKQDGDSGEPQDGQGGGGSGEKGEETEGKQGEGQPDDIEGQEEQQEATQTDNGKQERIEKLLEQLSSEGIGGRDGGKGVDDVIDELKGSNDFVRTTVAQNSDLVKKVNKAFSEIFTKNCNIAVKDGDLNIKRMQDAYLNEMVGEEGYDYHKMHKRETAFDCVILRDVSGSVDKVKEKYATITCILVAALQELHKTNVAVIDFGGSVNLTKQFDQPLIKSAINPKAGGGTPLCEALIKLNEMSFKHKTKLVVIVTDGSPDDPEGVKQLVVKPEYKGYTWLPILFDASNGRYHYDIKYCLEFMRDAFGPVEEITDISDLHKAVCKLIKEKGLS